MSRELLIYKHNSVNMNISLCLKICYNMSRIHAFIISKSISSKIIIFSSVVNIIVFILLLAQDLLDTELPVFKVCQQRCRPAHASVQTDQRLCYSLIGKYHIYTCFMRNFNILASLCS